MKKQKVCYVAVALLLAFVLWTLAVIFIDVQAIGPRGSEVGLATLNRQIHSATGAHMSLYVLTDWLGLVPIGFMLGFALLGLVQWIERKHLLKVDYSLFVLGGFYIVVMMAYIFFEMVVINYRPVLISGNLEASYPSSTTMLVLCVMPTAVMQLNAYIKNRALKRCASLLLGGFAVFMVAGRFVSGVHWFSDIVGGALLSAGLVTLYAYVQFRVAEKRK